MCFCLSWSLDQKHAIIKRILKKPNIDAFDLKSYWPVFNLSFISKFLERLVARRLLTHCDDHQLLPKYQSAYRAHHSTETALVCVINQPLCSIDSGDVCAPVLLDLSAAFDAVDHQHLLNVMQERFGIRGPVYNWLASYISGRSQAVTVNSLCSLPARLVCGVPQGSVLGPVVKINFYRSANAIFGRIGRICSEEVLLQLINSKCLPMLIYGMEVCPLGKSDLRALDLVAVHEIISDRQYRSSQACSTYVWFCAT